MEFVVFFWLGCAVCASIVASSKGRSGFGWFLLGLLFGVFALLVSIGMPSLRAPRTAFDEARNREHRIRFAIFMAGVFALLGALKFAPAWFALPQ